MTKFMAILLTALSISLLPLEAVAAGRNVIAPTGAERAKQFLQATNDCRKRFGGATTVYAEWAGHYGRTGWWCVHSR